MRAFVRTYADTAGHVMSADKDSYGIINYITKPYN